MFGKFTSVLIYFIYLLDPAYGSNVNTYFNLSSVEYQGHYIIDVFKVFFLNKTFPLNFGPHDYMYLQHISHQMVYGLKFRRSQNLIVKIADKRWNKSLEMVNFGYVVCKNRLFHLEVDFDDVLNDVFNCKNQVSGYVTRFNYWKEPNGYTFHNRSYIEWNIANKKMITMNNEKNFQIFLKECNSISSTLYFMVIGGIFALLFVLMIFIFWYLERIKASRTVPQNIINPIIMVAPINEI